MFIFGLVISSLIIISFTWEFDFPFKYLVSIPKNINFPLFFFGTPLRPNSSIIISLWFKNKFGNVNGGLIYNNFLDDSFFISSAIESSFLIFWLCFSKIESFFKFIKEFFFSIVSKLLFKFLSDSSDTSTTFNFSTLVFIWGLQHPYLLIIYYYYTNNDNISIIINLFLFFFCIFL